MLELSLFNRKNEICHLLSYLSYINPPTGVFCRTPNAKSWNAERRMTLKFSTLLAESLRDYGYNIEWIKFQVSFPSNDSKCACKWNLTYLVSYKLNQRHSESFGVLQNTSAIYYMRLPYLRCSLRFLWCKILTNHPKPMLTSECDGNWFRQAHKSQDLR